MSRIGTRLLILLTVVACACDSNAKRLDETLALQTLRQQLPPAPVTLGVGDWDRLKVLGLMTENRRSGSLATRYSVTAAGAEQGLEQVVERGPGSISISFRGRVCNREVVEVTSITPRDSGAAPVMEVAFIRRATTGAQLSPLFPDTATLREACDPTRNWPGRALLIADSAGWRVNRPPRFGEAPEVGTRYHYDSRGLLMGATSTATFKGWPEDPDGDSVIVRWLAPGDSVGQAIPHGAKGFQVSFRHIIGYGRPLGARGRLIATDSRGVADTLPVGVDFR